MKRDAISLTIGLALLAMLSGCHHMGVQGSGVRKTEKRELAPFTSIETTGAYELEVTCQKAASFEIEGDDNIVPLVETEVKDGVLRVTSSGSYNTSTPLSLRISVPDLASIKGIGAGKVQISDVKNDKFEMDSTGAVTMTASGQSKSLTISSTGAGKIDAHNLRAEKADVTVTGAAGVDVFASDQLDVTVSGAGRVTYSGNPKVNKHILGAGEVTKKEGGQA